MINTKSDARALAASIIKDVVEKEAFASIVLSDALDRSQLDPRDKAFCTELVYGTLRWYMPLHNSILRTLDKTKRKIDRRVLPHLLVAAYQLQHLADTVPAHAAVNMAIKSIKRVHPALGNFANAVLRNLGSAEHLMLTPESKSIAAYCQSFGFPSFFGDEIARRFESQKWYALFSGLNARPKTYFRFFGADEELKEWSTTPHTFVPDAYFFEKSTSARNPFAGAAWTVQDPASQTAALLVNARKGNLVVDMCAAPGTKSIVLAKSVQHEGKVVAIDISERKAGLIDENQKRLGVSLDIRVLDARSLPDDLVNQADAVLLDAPCSSLGTTRRHPEIKLRSKAEDIDALMTLQDALLDSAEKALKKGGVLVYSVCSPLQAEGHDRIEAFLKRHPNFKREKARVTLPWLPENAQNSFGEIELWPHLHDADAFFAARLVKL